MHMHVYIYIFSFFLFCVSKEKEDIEPTTIGTGKLLRDGHHYHQPLNDTNDSSVVLPCPRK